MNAHIKELNNKIEGGERAENLYILAVCPVEMKGAPQVKRGPRTDVANWRWCFWRADSFNPGGWPSIQRICTRRTLPRWARRVIRGKKSS